MTLIVDTRWSGPNGIGRYSKEVLCRLGTGWEPAKLKARPGSARDLLTPRVARTGQILYSPGYNAGMGGPPQIVTVHDLIHLRERSPKYDAYYRLVLRPAIKRAGMVFTVSSTSERAIAGWLNDPHVEIVNTGNGCSAEFTRRGLDRELDHFLFVGNLKPHKNFPVLLAALAQVPEARLTAVTPEPDAVRSLAQTLGVSGRVTAVSRLSDLELCDLYNRVAATLFPSRLEGFGLPALESIQSGTPVIFWTGCDSVAEIVGSDGLRVQSLSDAGEWAEAMRRYLSAKGPSVSAPRRHQPWDAVAETVKASLARYAGTSWAR